MTAFPTRAELLVHGRLKHGSQEVLNYLPPGTKVSIWEVIAACAPLLTNTPFVSHNLKEVAKYLVMGAKVSIWDAIKTLRFFARQFPICLLP
jgi:hypothetical protein